MNQKEYIDVDFVDVTEEKQEKQKEEDVTICADPISTLINGVCGIVNTLTSSITEYNMCRQQEQTKRAAIKAQMKVQIEQINAQKEVYLKALENRHQENMAQIEVLHQRTISSLENIRIGVEAASKIGDMEAVLSLIQLQTTFVEMDTKSQLSLMDKTSNPLMGLPKQSEPIGYLE